MAGIGVSLSGGGHRASLFGLGVLQYLVDAGKSHEVTSIASVSGGSLTNAFVAQSMDFAQASPEAFEETVKPFASQLAQKGTLQGRSLSTGYLLVMVATLLATGLVWLLPFARGTRFWIHLGVVAVWGVAVMSWMFATVLAKAYGVAMAVTLVAAALPPWFASLPHWMAFPFGRFVLFLVTMALWVSLVFARRGAVCAYAYRKTLFTRDGREDRLDAITTSIDHVLCSTELQSGEQLYFSGRFVYGYRYGKGSPGNLRLSVAAQASANLPFVFPARWMRAKPFGFRYPSDEIPVADRPPDWKPCPPLRQRPKSRRLLVLSDGGVYDNMADQWPQGFHDRIDCWPALATEHHEPEVLIVANASGGLEWKPMKRLLVPAIGGLLSILKVKDVLYDQTTAQRRAGLVGRFDRAALAERAGHPGYLKGALVHIPQSPYVVPLAFKDSTLWPDRAERAQKVLEELDRTDDDWSAVAEADTAVGTVLCRLGTETSARLIRHAYVLTMANLHTILPDFPWLPIPPMERFVRLVGG
jgi:predicted acylesterase/phospholipase RssA